MIVRNIFILYSLLDLFVFVLSFRFQNIHVSNQNEWSQRFEKNRPFVSYSIHKSSKRLHQAKQKPHGISKNVENYLRKRELDRLRKSGVSYDEIREAFINGTKGVGIGITGYGSSSSTSTSKSSPGYQRLVGKGTLDQRLRAIVAYKRSNIAGEALSRSDGNDGSDSILSASEEQELYETMESEEGDDEYYAQYGNNGDGDDDEEDEEALYETLVMNAIEQSKLSEMQKNFMLDKAALRSTETDPDEKSSDSDSSNNTSSIISELEVTMEISSKLNKSLTISDKSSSSSSSEDLYTPARSSWGVFQRPRDISKAYGGGRVISKEEMQAMDEEYERREKDVATKTRIFVNEAMKSEFQHENKIKDSLTRARGLMGIGNRHGAVELLESVKEFLSWQSDLGGEVWLEYAMALETVERSDDARKIYGQLVTASWNQKTRRNALQLLQGLDITAKIRKDVGPRKPIVDYEAMISVSKALEKGLRNEWDDYKKDRKKDNVLPWYDEEVMKDTTSNRVDNLEDAYLILMRVANPLKEIPADVIARAFRKIYASNETERVRFFTRRGILDDLPVESVLSPPKQKQTSTNTIPAYVGGDDIKSTMSAAVFSSFRSDLSESSSSSLSSSFSSSVPSSSSKQNTNNRILSSGRVKSSDAYSKFMNGSWDLVVSMSDRYPYKVKKFEVDSVIRTFDMMKATCSETIPIFWGMSSSTIYSSSIWNPKYCEIILEGDGLLQSVAPYQKKRQHTQNLQVLFCDDNIKVTRQQSQEISDPDLYCLWKRKKPPSWRKY